MSQHPQSQFTVFKLYQSVIDDVVNGMREAFLDEGVDEQVLQELRILWESKLVSTKAVDSSQDNPTAQESSAGGGNAASSASKDTNGHIEKHPIAPAAPPTTSASQQLPPPSQPQAVLPPDPTAQVPIQITMPRLVNDPPSFERKITIHVPASCIQTNKLQDILSLPAIQATLSLPTDMAAAALQGQINQALGIVTDIKPNASKKGFLQVDGGDNCSDDEAMAPLPLIQPTVSLPTEVADAVLQGQINQALGLTVKIKPNSSKKRFVQVDGQAAGGGDSSEDEDEDDDDDDDLDDDADDRDEDGEEEREEEGQDEEPLNSDDDVSDAEGSSDRLYDIENVVVCQFDKITRTRNKWKFHLKDGIMNLNGKDYVFQKATGDAEW